MSQNEAGSNLAELDHEDTCMDTCGLLWWNLKVFTTIIFFFIPRNNLLPNFRLSWLVFALWIDRTLANFLKVRTLFLHLFFSNISWIFLAQCWYKQPLKCHDSSAGEEVLLALEVFVSLKCCEEGEFRKLGCGEKQLNVRDKIMRRQFIICIKIWGW